MSQALKLHHDLGDVVLKPSGKPNQARLKKMIRSTLDQSLDEDRVVAKTIHDEAKQRHGTPTANPAITCASIANVPSLLRPT